MAGIFGIDFGTTNSVASFIQRDPEQNRWLPEVFADEQGRPHPSVVWYAGADTVVGRQAKDHLGELGLGVFGDIVRSPKMFLGSQTGIHIGGVTRSAREVVSEVIRFIRDDAKQKEPSLPFDRAVFTIPVSMDGRARAELRQAALAAGVHVHQFVHEPLAALYGYLRSLPEFEELRSRLERRLVLVFDWGGGTLDLTLCRFQSGALVQVVNVGDAEVGGDAFDLEILKLVKRKHAEAHPTVDWTKLQPTAEARLISQCEAAKIALSAKERHLLFVKDILATSGPERDLDVAITRQELESVTSHLVSKGLEAIDRVLQAARIPRTAVEFCLATGGIVAMPAIQQRLIQYFDSARVRTVKNAATVIAEGAAWIAHDGLRVQLAKPIEVLHADNVYFPILRAGTPMPPTGEEIRQPISLYCADPRDGVAKITLARSRWPGSASTDARIPYGCLTVEVDACAAPLRERLSLTVSIDHDCIARVTAISMLRGGTQALEIHDLEFGLGLTVSGPAPDQTDIDSEGSAARFGAGAFGAVQLRSNVTQNQHAKELVPGDLAESAVCQRQRDEKTYYLPCSECARNAFEITRYGCDRCAPRGQAKSPAEADREYWDNRRRREAELNADEQREAV
jgi:actin-like ATPase involved in cell morphogenesis